MFFVDNIHKSLLWSVRQVIPSGVPVRDGEVFGLNFDDPTVVPPSVTVTLEDQYTAAIELGSTGTTFDVVLAVNAQSRQQRDALKSILYNYLVSTDLPVYTSFVTVSGSAHPASGATPYTTGQFGGTVIVRDMPDLSQGREQFFWTALVYAEVSFTEVK